MRIAKSPVSLRGKEGSADDAKRPCIEAEANHSEARVKSLLVEQVTRRVRWEASVRKALHMGITTAYELGHGKVLRGLVKRITKDINVTCLSSTADFDVLDVRA